MIEKLSLQEPPVTKNSFLRNSGSLLIKFFNGNRASIGTWFSWRVALFIIPVFAAAFIPRPPVYVTQSFSSPFDPWIERFISSWSQWDSGWYITIADKGYTSDLPVAFYPFYPMLMRGLTFIISFGQPDSANYIIAGIIISSLAALAFCITLRKLLQMDYSEEITKLTLFSLLAFPTAFFLVAVYTEGLFMALSVGAFYAARRNRWFLAMVLTACVVITRQQGVLVGLALLAEYSQQIGWKWQKINYRVIFFFFLPALTLAGWFTWNLITFGNFFAPLTATQKYWGRYFSLPTNSVLLEVGGFLYNKPGNNSFGPLSQYWDAMPVLNIAITLLFIILAVVGITLLQKGQLRLSYFIYMVGCLVMPLSSPNSDDPLHSLPRYLLLSFPTFIVIAFLGNRSTIFRQGWLLTSISLLGLLLGRFSLGYWVA